MKTEKYYCWKVLTQVGDEAEPRLLMPWSDKHYYENPFDYLADTREEAYELLEMFGAKDHAKEEGWVLCTVTWAPVERYKEDYE